MAAQALNSYQSLVKEIKGGLIAPLYLLSGEEQVLAEYIVSVLVEQLVPEGMRSLNFQRLDGQKTSEAEFMRAVQTPPMFGEKRVVVLQEPGFVKAKGEGQERLTALFGNWPDFTCGVLLCPQLDRRLKLVSGLQQQARVADFPALTAREAALWVDDRLRRAGIGARGLGKLVVERAGTSLRILRLEVDKLTAYADGEKLCEQDIPFIVRNQLETNIFDLVDTIGHRRLEQGLQLLSMLHTEGQAPLYILAMISRQLRLILQARIQLDRGLSQREAAMTLGIHPFPAGKCVSQAENWTEANLRQGLSLCLAADEVIKTGQLPDIRSLERLLLQLSEL